MDFAAGKNPRPKTGKDAGFWPAQGIEAEIPQTPGLKRCLAPF
jgi:hypothetical protein